MIELLRKRRSIRKFKDQIIDQEKIGILIEATTRSPSSRNRQPWGFHFVEDAIMLNQLSTAKQKGSDFLKGAPLGVVITGDERVSDVWIEDCSIAAIILQLTAESLGLGSCWIQIRKRNRSELETAESYVQGVMNFESHIRVECIIAIGYPDESVAPITNDELNTDKVKNH